VIIYSYKYYKYSFYDNSFGIMKGEEFMSFLEQIIERAKSDVKNHSFAGKYGSEGY